MRCSYLLWSGIVQSLVAVEAFVAANSHSQQFAIRPAAASIAGTTASATVRVQRSSRPTALSTAAVEISGGGGGGVGETQGTATIPNEVFNLVKSIVGAGVLSVRTKKRFCRWLDDVLVDDTITMTPPPTDDLVIPFAFLCYYVTYNY